MIIRTFIEFEWDTEESLLEFDSKDEAIEYAISSMSDDIDNLVKMNEIRDVIQVEIVEE